VVNAFLAHISLDSTTQSSDQFATTILDASNITPSGSGVANSSFTISGSVPTCAF
jgi:polygalacturonase